MKENTREKKGHKPPFQNNKDYITNVEKPQNVKGKDSYFFLIHIVQVVFIIITFFLPPSPIS